MEKLQELKEIFKVGEKYSIYRIDSMMAMTGKAEILVKQIEDNQIIFTKRDSRTKRLGRKLFVIKIESRSYQSAPMVPFESGIFLGWDQPIKADTEYRVGVMRGNACYNFVASVLEIQAWILSGQLTPFFDRSRVVAIIDQQSNSGNGNEVVVFPDEVQPGQHAVIDRILAAAS